MDLQKSASLWCKISTRIHESVLEAKWYASFLISVRHCRDPLFSLLSLLEAEDVGAKNVDLQKSASPRCEIKTRFHSSVLGEHWCSLFLFSVRHCRDPLFSLLSPLEAEDVKEYLDKLTKLCCHTRNFDTFSGSTNKRERYFCCIIGFGCKSWFCCLRYKDKYAYVCSALLRVQCHIINSTRAYTGCIRN